LSRGLSLRIPRAKGNHLGKKIEFSRPVAPEDLRIGDYVAVLSIRREYLPSVCAGDTEFRPVRPYRVELSDWCDGEPLRIVAVCLPFAAARSPLGRVQWLNLRSDTLVRLSRAYGRTAVRAARDKKSPEDEEDRSEKKRKKSKKRKRKG